jgi:hypothetical protein
MSCQISRTTRMCQTSTSKEGNKSLGGTPVFPVHHRNRRIHGVFTRPGWAQIPGSLSLPGPF